MKINMRREVIKHILKEYVESNHIVLTEQQLNETLLTEGWKDILLGIALLTGVNLGKVSAQTAKNVISDKDARNKIETVLKDTSILNKITKNLSPEIKDKINSNADKALAKLGGRHTHVSSIKATDKDLSSKISRGYVPTNVDTKTFTITTGVADTITYIDTLDIAIQSDGLFVTGGYELSPEGAAYIQSLKDSITDVGGKITSVQIESSTDKEPIKMGNEKLAKLRAESISNLFEGVDNINTKILPNQGPDIFKQGLGKSERESARQKTSPYRYVKFTVTAEYQDSIVESTVPVDKVIEKNTYTLIKVMNSVRFKDKFKTRIKKLGGFKVKKIGRKTNCKVDSCPRFGNEKILKFLDFSHQ